MIHEYRTYTLTPGQLDRYLQLADSRVRPIRQDAYGRLLAFWTTEFGPLNQVHHLWEYASLDERQRLRRELAANRDWCELFLAGAWPTMQVQEVRFMLPSGGFVSPDEPSALHERRIYRAPAGRFTEAAHAVRARPLHATACRVGVWTSETPQPNEVVEVVAYRSFEARRADASTSEPQRAWFAQHAGLFQHVDSVLLLPTAISPIQ